MEAGSWYSAGETWSRAGWEPVGAGSEEYQEKLSERGSGNRVGTEREAEARMTRTRQQEQQRW